MSKTPITDAIMGNVLWVGGAPCVGEWERMVTQVRPAEAFAAGIEAAAKVCQREWQGANALYKSQVAGTLMRDIRAIPNPFAGEDQHETAAGQTTSGVDSENAGRLAASAAAPLPEEVQREIDRLCGEERRDPRLGYWATVTDIDLERIARLAIASKGEGK